MELITKKQRIGKLIQEFITKEANYKVGGE
jgi:hypothetical protein